MYKKKKIVVISMCVMILCMIIGYAAFSSNLKINGTATIETKWEILFTKIEKIKTVGKASERITPTVNGTTATFHVDLIKPGDSMEYKITVENRGTFDAIIEDIQGLERGSEAVKFKLENIKKGDKLAKGTSTTFNVTVYFDSSITDNPEELDNNLTIEVKYSQDTGQNIPSETPVIKSTKLATRILQDNTAQSDSSIDFSKISSDTNGKGLYYTNKNTEGNKTTYYFRGEVENNYVSFAGFIWRIVRINEDRSVRLIKQDTIGSSIFDTNAGDNAFVGYMHGKPTTYQDGYGKWSYSENLGPLVRTSTSATVKVSTSYTFNPTTGFYSLTNPVDGKYTSAYHNYYACIEGTESVCKRMAKLLSAVQTNAYNELREAEVHSGYFSSSYGQAHKNETSSVIKSNIDNWYQSNLASYNKYLADAGFCTDRSKATKAGDWRDTDTALGYGNKTTYYGTIKRIYTGHAPQFACPNEAHDLFTTNTSDKGNKGLTYPIGLITIDEVSYAGGVYGVVNNSYYLYSGLKCWTMSAFNFRDWDSRSVVWMVLDTGSIGSAMVTESNAIRPVINVKGNVEIISGNGTSNSPYVILTD